MTRNVDKAIDRIEREIRDVERSLLHKQGLLDACEDWQRASIESDVSRLDARLNRLEADLADLEDQL